MYNKIKLINIKMLRCLLTIIVIIIIAYYIINNYDNIKLYNYRYLYISILLPLSIIPIISNNRWKYFLSIHNIQEKFFSLAKINFMSVFYGLIFPSSQGLDIFKILYIEKKHPDKRGIVGSTVIFDRILGLVCLCIISLITTFFFSHLKSVPNLRLTVFIISTICLLICFIILSNKTYNIIYKILYIHNYKYKLLNNILLYMNKLHETLSTSTSLKVFINSFILITILQLITILNVYLVFRAMGIYLPYYIHLMIMPIVYIVSMVPITISGFGVREGMFAYMYGLFGVSAPQAVAVSILNYSILTLIPAFIGFLIVIFSKAKKPQF